MPTPFTALSERLSEAVDGYFAERFRFDPYKASDDVDLPPVADGSRASFEVPGRWFAPSQSRPPHARGATQDDNAHNWTASKPVVMVTASKLIWTPRPGDRVTRLEDGAIYQISAPPRPDGLGHIAIPVTDRAK